jgi:uncharacterized protein (DUF1015 family)
MIYAFRAIRPRPELVDVVTCPPYDVINTQEACELAEGKPLSFLRVIRPEVTLPEGTDEHDDAVYTAGRKSLDEIRGSDAYEKDDAPSLYIYRLTMNGRAQTGIFATVAVKDYDEGRIVRHEKTRADKEDDRTRHIVEQRAHAEPVMLAYRDDDGVDALVAAEVERAPLLTTTYAGVLHEVWKVAEPEALQTAFRAVDKLYVADGHHRCKAASRAAAELRGTPEHTEAMEYFPAVVFPKGQMHIMPYNRIIKSLPVEHMGEFAKGLNAALDAFWWSNKPTPAKHGDITVYLGKELGWMGGTLPATALPTVADTLDVARLGEWVLAPLLGIVDPRTDTNIGFVGGIRGTVELEKLVDTGKAACAIAMYPTSMEELLAVSDADLLMPPKSTWFEPKLLSGLLIHCCMS